MWALPTRTYMGVSLWRLFHWDSMSPHHIKGRLRLDHSASSQTLYWPWSGGWWVENKTSFGVDSTLHVHVLCWDVGMPKIV